MSGLFITGTDTGVGKTVVSCTIARALRSRGVDIGVMKPAETGVPAGGPEDALALIEAAGVSDPVDLVCPQQYDLPAAPLVSARAEKRTVDLGAIENAYRDLSSRHEAMLLEGAGGLLVPLTESINMADLAQRLELPVLLVARASLGTINHTLLSVEACERRGLDLIGVVLSHATGVLSDADAMNLTSLRESLGDRLIGEILPLEADATDGPDDSLRLDRIASCLSVELNDR